MKTSAPPELSPAELGRALHLFHTDPRVGPGLPLWLPDGATVRGELQRLADEEAALSGCRQVYTPALAKAELFETSGHLAKFGPEMYPPMPVGGERYLLRPANCPHHAMVFAARAHSYRELPVRYHELGAMFRNELSGVLAGLSRVRQINLDDTHVFAGLDQLEDEVVAGLQSIRRVHAALGFDSCEFRLSLPDKDSRLFGERGDWEHAARALAGALDRLGLDYYQAEGEAAFYGPKIDIQLALPAPAGGDDAAGDIADARPGAGGRASAGVPVARGQLAPERSTAASTDSGPASETVATVQVDFVQPQRFQLSYLGPDGAHHRPVMVHRGVVGSMERVLSLLLQVHGGRLPFWINPHQLVALPVAGEAAARAAEQLIARSAPVRAEIADRGSLGHRIRAAREQRAGLIAVIGPREATDGTVDVLDPADDSRRQLPVGQLAEVLRRAIAERRAPRWDSGPAGAPSSPSSPPPPAGAEPR